MIPITDKEFEQFRNYIKGTYGINLGPEKKALLTGRLWSTLVHKGLNSFSEYYQYVVGDNSGQATVELLDKITTNHTFFMREPEHFQFFRTVALPQLELTVKDRDLRVWSAGCSTGQEAYTLSMLLNDHFSAGKGTWDTTLLATDISTRALAKACAGVYSSEEIADLPLSWRRDYFRRVQDDSWAVTDALKQKVVFRNFNLMEGTFPFKRRFHVIFCRNVMIYFDEGTRLTLLEKFWNTLEFGGYLFLGHTEFISREHSAFRHVCPSVYRKEAVR